MFRKPTHITQILSVLLTVFFAVLLMPTLTNDIAAQNIQTAFGKNRVQYHDFEWSFYETENFIIYFYQGGQDLAKFALRVAETEIENVQNKLEHQLNDKIELMVYHNHSDLLQTNIGQNLEEQQTGGTTSIAANKVFVYFDGDHENLKLQIIEGIAQVHFENMVFGTSLQEIIQNAVLLNLPTWFSEGLIAYITEDWNVELDDRLRKIAGDKKFKKFNRLTKDDARFAGHALWHYIAENFGESSIPNILYLTRINRSVESGFLFVLGNESEFVINEWLMYIEEMAMEESASRQNIGIAGNGKEILKSRKRAEKEVDYERPTLSPDGSKLAYSTNEIGENKVYLLDLTTNEKKKLLKTGFKTYQLPIGHTYPLLAWNKLGNKLGIVYEKRDIIYLRIINVNTEEVVEHPITKFQQVFDFTFTADDRRIVFSAMQKGQSDLFSYFIPNTKVYQLTKDFYDDIDIDYAELDGRRGIVFRSNRDNDTLSTSPIRFDTLMPQANFDIYFYDLEAQNQSSSQTLVQLTNTPSINEKLPKQFNDKYFSYLSDQNGIYNRFAVAFDTVLARIDTVVYFPDSTIVNPDYPLDSLTAQIDSIQINDVYKTVGKSYPLTNYQSNLEYYDVVESSDKVIELNQSKGIYTIYEKIKNNEPDTSNITLKPTPYKRFIASKNQAVNDSLDTTKEILDNPFLNNNKFVEDTTQQTTTPIDSNLNNDAPYYFQSEFDILEKEQSETGNLAEEFDYDVLNSTTPKKKDIRLSRVRGYAPRFAIDGITAQPDNSIFPFNQYQSYTLEPTGGFNPDLKAFFKVSISDLFEDHKLQAGFRLPFSGLNHMEYFLNYRNLEKQLDRQWTYYRKSYTYDDPSSSQQFPNHIKNVTNYGQLTLGYPLDIVRRVALHIAYRQDQKIYLSSPEFLGKQSDFSQWIELRLDYVFDNTIPVTTNILNGMRYKFYAEFHKPFSAVLNDNRFSFDINKTGWMGVIGGDIRHYQKVHREIVWANRFSFAKSVGTQKVVYFIGGVDNWMTLSGNFTDKQDKRFDNDTPISQDANYAFQSLTPHLRGFKFNVRNGSNYVLWNSELRVPIFTYLINRQMRSQFFRELQLTAFTDAGTAWEVGTPFSEENRYFTYTYSSPNTPVTVNAQYFKNPIVLGYGFGVRSTLLGYYLKLDRAWGIDSNRRNDGMWYISLGTDF